jgi:hypothetical protein
MSSCTHVSESLPVSSLCESVSGAGKHDLLSKDDKKHDKECKNGKDAKNVKDNVEKDRMVVHYVVETLFSDKKRKLALAIDDEMERAMEKRVETVDCQCGCKGAPCKKRVIMRENYRQKVAHKLWPELEKELIRDVSEAMLQSRRSNMWLSKELSQALHENTILKARISVVASIF